MNTHTRRLTRRANRTHTGIVTMSWCIVTRTSRTFTTGTDINGGILLGLEDGNLGLLGLRSGTAR
jgi:hypothetical protein